MDNNTALVLIIIILIILFAIYVTRNEKKKYFKLYTDALKQKNRSDAIAYGRKYYSITEGSSNAAKINIELSIQNDLKMANID